MTGDEAGDVVDVRWSDTAAPVELALPCSGEVHRLRWHRGIVQLTDHPDRDAEEALVALGGPRPACLATVQLWDLALADGGFLEEWVDDTHLTPARLSWLTMALERLRNEGFHEFLRSLPPDRAEPMGRFLHAFPRPWLDRAAASIAETVSAGGGVRCVNAPPLIRAAIAQRVRRAFAAAVGGNQLPLGAAALVPLWVDVAETARPTIEGSIRGPARGVRVEVGVDWLHRVWAAGAAVVDGHLVLEVGRPLGPKVASALVADWTAGRPEVVPVAVRYADDGWLIDR